MTKATIAATAIILFMSLPTDAFIGNIKLGGWQVPCAIGCGGDRGIVNPNFVGDLVYGQVTGPSIDKFEQAGNRVVDRAAGELNKILEKKSADFTTNLEKMIKTQAGELIGQLTQLRTESIEQLDTVLQDALKETDRILRKNLDLGDITLYKNTVRFERMLKNVFVWGVCLIFLSYAAWLWMKLVGPKKEPWKAGIRNVVRAGACAILVGVFGYWIISATYSSQLEKVRENLKTGYANSLERFEFSAAAIFAEQLSILEDFGFRNEELSAHAEKTKILRDVFGRITSYKTVAGLESLYAKISNAQSAFETAGLKRDPDLDTAAAMILWQQGQDRLTEYQVASRCASILERETSFWGYSKHFAFKPLALHYMKMYLGNPIKTEYYKMVGFDLDAENQLLTNGGWKYYPLAELQRIYANVPNRPVWEFWKDAKVLPDRHPLFPYVKYGEYSSKVHRRSIPMYVHFILRKEGTTSKDLAYDIINDFVSYTDNLKDPLFEGTSVRFMTLKGPLGISARAQQYFKSEPPAQPLYIKWVNDLIGPILGNGRSLTLFRSLADDAFSKQKQELDIFESKSNELLTAIETMGIPPDQETKIKILRIAHEAAISAAKAGLFTCLNTVTCEGDVSETRSAVENIFEIVPEKIRPSSLKDWSDAIELSLQTRILPAI